MNIGLIDDITRNRFRLVLLRVTRIHNMKIR